MRSYANAYANQTIRSRKAIAPLGVAIVVHVSEALRLGFIGILADLLPAQNDQEDDSEEDDRADHALKHRRALPNYELAAGKQQIDAVSEDEQSGPEQRSKVGDHCNDRGDNQHDRVALCEDEAGAVQDLSRPVSNFVRLLPPARLTG